MAVWERERVLALSPDPASMAAGQRLAEAGRWSALGKTDRALWGLCQGSGSRPYRTVVDRGAELAYACSCPSRKLPCKHALGLLLLWSAGDVPSAATEADFASDWLRARSGHVDRVSAEGGLVDPVAAGRRVADRVARVSAGLEDLDRWLTDQVRDGLAGLERAGYAHFDRMAARMVDAQAPGVASMLRAVPAELASDGWPERVLERLAALHLLIRAHRRIDELPAELAANVRSRIGYPVAKADVLATTGIRDGWLALGAVDTIEYQLQTRRVWLYGTLTERWALWLTFAAPGLSMDTSVRPGQLIEAELHFYPGSGLRAVVGARDGSTSMPAGAAPVPAETLSQAQRGFASSLAMDPWAMRRPTVLAATPVPPQHAGGPWRLRDPEGACVDAAGLAGDPWLLLARSGGEPIDIFGEWAATGFRPLSLLPDRHGGLFTMALTS